MVENLYQWTLFKANQGAKNECYLLKELFRQG